MKETGKRSTVEARLQRSSQAAMLAVILLSCLAAMNGCVISPRRVVGGSTSPTPTPTPTPGGTPNPSAAGKLYVSDQTGNAILRFDSALTATGNIHPNAVISGANTGLNGPQFMALDTAADRLFVANGAGSSVLIWDAASTLNGNIAPTRSISGANTGLIAPIGIALDRGRDLLYVADGSQVFVYSPASTANGNATPVRDIIIGGSNLNGLLLDAGNDRLYVSDTATNAIGIFDNASTLNGTATSTRAIAGASTGLATPSGMALDLSGNLVVANQGNGSLTVYASAAIANGNVSPIATVSGASTTLSSPAQVILNPASSNNEVYVADSSVNEVAVFDGVNTSGANASPARDIVSATAARGVALDTTR
jgi:SMP-30/Gluconolactonase/LRE-like region